MEALDFATIISIAIMGSLGHCIGMCGGIVVAYSSSKFEPQTAKIRQFFSHLLYASGRITSYMFIGAVAGLVGQSVSFSIESKAIFFLLIGVLMILAGLSLFGKMRFLNSIEHNLSSSRTFKKLFTLFIHSKNLSSFYALGVLNGFIPCGFVYFFVFSAAASGSMLMGAMIMLVFGLCTIPPLLSLGFFVSIMQQTSLRKLFLNLAAISIILFGIYTIYKSTAVFL